MCYCEEGICLPWRKEEGGVDPTLLKAGAWLNLSVGRKQGRKQARSAGWLHWTSRVVMERGPTQRYSSTQLGTTQLHEGRAH